MTFQGSNSGLFWAISKVYWLATQVNVDSKLDGQAESLGGKIEAGRKELQAVLESEVARLEREDEDIKKRMAGDKLELSRRTDEVAQNVVRERDERVEACDRHGCQMAIARF